MGSLWYVSSLTHQTTSSNYPRYWPFLRGIQRSPVNSPHKGQWRGALMLSLICIWINNWLNSRETGDLRRYRAHYDVTVMKRFYLRSGLCLCDIVFTNSCVKTRVWCFATSIPNRGSFRYNTCWIRRKWNFLNDGNKQNKIAMESPGKLRVVRNKRVDKV